MGVKGGINSVVKKSIADTVADNIRSAILNGRILPGEKLREQELCQELNVSRTPLREAFRILQTQNLINYSPFIGVTVVEVTPRFVEEMWYIKSILVPETIALALKKITQPQIQKLNSLIEELEGKQENFHLLDSKFHLEIARYSGNEELYKLLINIYEGTVLARSLTVLNTRSIKNSCDEHRQILKAIEEGDERQGRRHMLDHLERSKQAILKNLQ